MHRILTPILVVLIAVLAVQPAAAGGPSARQVEKIAVELERLFQPLSGAVARENLVFTHHGGGLFSMSLGLASTARTGIDARDEEKPLKLLAAGHMASEPTSPATSVNAVVSDLETSYNIWWAVANLGEEELTRRTAVRITGPEEFELSVSDGVDYGPGAIHFFWFNPETIFPVGGVYTHRTTVKSAGKNLYKYWVE